MTESPLEPQPDLMRGRFDTPSRFLDLERPMRQSAAWVTPLLMVTVAVVLMAAAARGIGGLPAFVTSSLPVPSTLVAMAVLAVALGALRTGRPLAAGLAVMVAVAGFVSLGWQVVAPTAGLAAGVVALPPADAFALLSLAAATLLLAPDRASGIALQAARALAGTGAGVHLLLATPPWAPAAVPHLLGATAAVGTSVVLILLAVIVLGLARTEAGPGRLARLDAYAAWIPVLLAALVFVAWLKLEDNHRSEQAVDLRSAVDTVRRDVSDRLSARALALQRLAQRWQVYAPVSEAQFQHEAGTYLRDFADLSAIHLVDTQLAVRWWRTRAGGRAQGGDTLAAEDGRMAAFEAAARSGSVRITPAVPLGAGGAGLILVAPVQRRGQPEGFIAATLQAADVLALIDAPALRNYSVALRDGGVLLGASSATAAPGPWPGLGEVVNAFGREWSLEVRPSRGYLQRMRSRLPESVFLLGMLASALLAASLLQLRRSVAGALATQALSTRLSTMLETITDAFFTLDRDWHFTYVNREAGRVLQQAPSQLLGRNVWEAFPEAVGSVFEQQYRDALQRQVTAHFEAYYPPLGRWFSVRAYPGDQGLAVYFQDVTELFNSRQAVKAREQELRALAEAMPQIVWMSDTQGHLSYLNQRWVDYSGMPLAASMPDGWLRCVHPDDRRAMRRAWHHAGAHEVPFSAEVRLQRQDGQWRWMLTRAVPYRPAPAEAVKWMGTCTDIDDLKRSAEVVRASEERFRLVSDATHDAIIDVDPRAGPLWWNENFERQFGAVDASQAPTFGDWIERVHPEDRAALLEMIEGDRQPGTHVCSLEHRFRRADGEWARVRTRGHVMRDGLGRAVRLLASMSDVTRQLALEEQLRQLQRLESLGQLTGGVAHDFNNLLTIIMGNAEVLGDALERDATLQPLARVLVSAAERGAQLTQRLLAFARRQALQPLAVDVGRALQDLRSMLQRTLGEQIGVQVRVADGLWRALVDPGQLDNALLNLCLNARDAMPHGGRLVIEATNASLDDAMAGAHPQLRAGDYVRIAVRDTGVGIAPEVRSKVFEPFFTTKEKNSGNGLGLAMVYGFILQSGGHIELESVPGRGTEVVVLLPRAAAGAATPPSGPDDGADLQARGEAVLLVEDDDLVREYATDQLRALGYRVTAAADGAQALALLATGITVDLLFTDVIMPGMSGPQLAEAARELHPGLPVLYASGYTGDALARHGELAPDVLLLLKPYRARELARALRRALRPPAAAVR
ncbi:PAS domain S-box protein [Ramlibacter sp.]|uniref:PAS domain S-box protein n=1 Tax=Ramlibacter sp. TaxID=1917967 RepID=UPI0035AF8BB0